MVKINPGSKIWFLTRIGREIEGRIERWKWIFLSQNFESREEKERFSSKCWILRGERDFSSSKSWLLWTYREMKWILQLEIEEIDHFLSRFSRDRGSRQCLICHYIYKFGAYRRPIYVYRQPPTPRPYYIQPKHPTNIQPTIAEVRVWLDRVPVTPNRYLFLGSTRYYTIF